MKLIYLHTNPVSSNQANIIQVLYMCDALSKVGFEVELLVPDDGRYYSEKELDDIVLKKINKVRKFKLTQYKSIRLFNRFKVFSNYLGLRKKIICNDGDLYLTRTPIILPLFRKIKS